MRKSSSRFWTKLGATKRTQVLKVASCALGVAVLGAGLFLYSVTESLARLAVTVPWNSSPSVSPALLGLRYETWRCVSSDGVLLAGWYVPGESLSRVPPLVVVHGLGASKEFMLNYIALGHRLGMGVLAVDLRGHGESQKTLTSLGYREPLDLEAWEKELRSRGLPPPVVWGISLGAVTALRFASRHPEVAGLIADAPFDTLRHTLAIHGELLFGSKVRPLVGLVAWELQHGYGVPVQEVDCVAAASQVRCPTLVLAAEEDRRMPIPVVRRVFDALPGPKRWWVIPGTTHEKRPFTQAFCRVIEDFLRFCIDLAQRGS
ncbi:alpha/beta hydrolase [Candidatus Methylacidithermus pantelleriae]|uniref:Alpha/beta superfamily hydrolase (Modular protein) n=1 Tax=Candidatus Methylacidithermus pantelleriae TaxID=2744239 RepID=A0A8J2BHY8_9BACT|nr:alpha/beta hydrolase [Candidatus Methylacidithermus pantelleriae]CAF0691873.1 Alpha/beta superfamily hydrolase (Modular protein) [Candidatus Methylacidithermus pantelleriae]